MTLIESLLARGILVSPDVLEDPVLMELLEKTSDVSLEGIDVINKEFFKSSSSQQNKSYKVVFSYNKKPGKISVSDFVAYFNRRFEGLSAYIGQRIEFQGTMSINRLKTKKDREKVSVIGLVYEKSISKKNNIILNLEDPTGNINILIKPDKKELYEQAKDVVLDELIGVEGVISGGYVFPNHIFFPEIPSTKELKKGPEEEYVAFVGDLHLGSKVFLKESFEDFIDWMNLKKGSEEQRAVASKVKYIIFTGDLVEGVGVYPGQEEDLVIKDIAEQYRIFSNYVKKLPSHIIIFICPGNHDVGRISEPQPPINHTYADELRKLSNVVLVSSPSLIRVGIKSNFPGFDMLIYHGYSMIYYANNIESIRNKGGQKRPDLIMKLLLQKRHLAPSHTSNLYIPDREEDPLIIRDIPDFFVTGHIHRLSVGQYKNITLLNCSCWSDTTEDQEKRGLEPQPGKLPIVNLKTREVKIINFMKEKEPKSKEEPASQDMTETRGVVS
jgi:DNA polymerase II small subunit